MFAFLLLRNQIQRQFADAQALQAQSNRHRHRRKFVLPDIARHARRQPNFLQAFDDRERRFANLRDQKFSHLRQPECVPQQIALPDLLALRARFVKADRALNVRAQIAQRRFDHRQNLIHLRRLRDIFLDVFRFFKRHLEFVFQHARQFAPGDLNVAEINLALVHDHEVGAFGTRIENQCGLVRLEFIIDEIKQRHRHRGDARQLEIEILA